jgi:hypothetical protein
LAWIVALGLVIAILLLRRTIWTITAGWFIAGIQWHRTAHFILVVLSLAVIAVADTRTNHGSFGILGDPAAVTVIVLILAFAAIVPAWQIVSRNTAGCLGDDSCRSVLWR